MRDSKFLIEWIKDGVVHYLKLVPEKVHTHNFAGQVTGESIIELEVWTKDASEAYQFPDREFAEKFGNGNGLFSYYPGSKVEEHEFI
jgi:hypothetical protein